MVRVPSFAPALIVSDKTKESHDKKKKQTFGAAADWRVEPKDVFLRCPLVDLAGHLGRDGGAVDNDGAGAGMGQKRAGHIEDIGRVGDTDDDEVGKGGHLLHRPLPTSLLGGKGGRLARGPRARHERKATCHQIAGHALAHQPQLMKLSGPRCQKCF